MWFTRKFCKYLYAKHIPTAAHIVGCDIYGNYVHWWLNGITIKYECTRGNYKNGTIKKIWQKEKCLFY